MNHGLPDKPRTAENQTPLDLAIEAGHKKTAQILSILSKNFENSN